MNAPFSWPKSSLAMSSLGMAPVWTGTKGPWLRRLRLWRARATSSLPVPDSPTMSTGATVGATRSMRAKTSRIRAEPPTMPSKTVGRDGRCSSSPDLAHVVGAQQLAQERDQAHRIERLLQVVGGARA